jgi:hypothetical protein
MNRHISNLIIKYLFSKYNDIELLQTTYHLKFALYNYWFYTKYYQYEVDYGYYKKVFKKIDIFRSDEVQGYNNYFIGSKTDEYTL